MSYEMYTERGDAVVARVVREVEAELPAVVNEERMTVAVDEIRRRVYVRDPSKFAEVYDTAVREAIWADLERRWEVSAATVYRRRD